MKTMIYVVGGKGFVGSAIVRECVIRDLPHKIITRENAIDFVGTSCDLLINANGNSKKYLSNDTPLWDFDASVRSVRESLCTINSRKYILLSSCDVYTNLSNPQFNTEDANIDVSKQSAYGFHKYMAEQCVMHAAKEWLIFRMGGFVGTGLKKNPIFDILNDNPLWLDPGSQLQFINVSEAAKIILDFAISEERNQIYNLCGKGLISLQEVLDITGKNQDSSDDISPVCYNICIDKILNKTPISNTRETVIGFVNDTSKEGI